MPWKNWKGEIELLPISSKTLFRKDGLPIDLVENYLISEGYLSENETLLEILKDSNNLKRVPGIVEEDSQFGLAPDDWNEEDYEYYFKERSIL